MVDTGEQLAEILKTLSAEQLRFVAARLVHNSDADAAKAAGLAASSAYSWPNKPDVNEAVRLARLDSVMVAQERLRRLLLMAVDVLEDKMRDAKDKDRLAAAREVLDRVGPAIRQALDVTSAGQPLRAILTWGDAEDANAGGDTTAAA